MIVPITLTAGIAGSIYAESFLPIVGALVLCVILHEMMLLDIHNHVARMEDLDG